MLLIYEFQGNLSVLAGTHRGVPLRLRASLEVWLNEHDLG